MKFNKRHFVKTITWRIIASVDTLFLVLLFSGNIENGIKILGLETLTKMVLYYSHEHFWFKSKIYKAKRRHILKTISWRALGTIDTIIVSGVIIGNPLAALKIGGMETVTKLILYYIHERLWYRINFGLDQRRIRKRGI